MTPRIANARQSIHRRRAIFLGRIIQFGFTVGRFRKVHKGKLEVALWLLLAAAGAALLGPLQNIIGPMVTKDVFANLQTLIITVGGAMIGATAIVSSFVLFAMQVNVERLPYGLFNRFSSDWRLLTTFGTSFLLAIAGTALSLIADRDFAALMIVAGAGAVILILRLLLLAYRRSLILVNPVQQLGFVHSSAARQMGRWNRRLGWLMPLVEVPTPDPGKRVHNPRIEGPRTDLRRMAVLRANPRWDRGLRDAISQAVAYARRAGENGDLEVSAAALTTVVALNQLYVRVKGHTFHANNMLIENPFVTDGLINSTLEDLRRLRTIAFARSDERQIEQIFRTFLALVQTYAGIEYPGIGSTKTHAHLAAGYLERSVEAALPVGMVDVAMIGLGVMSEAALPFLRLGRPTEITSLAGKIGTIGCVGTLKEDYRPITMTAMEQLSSLTLTLLRVDNAEVGFAAREVRGSILLIAKMFLNVSDGPMMSTHSTYLGPFFSGTSSTAFRAVLTELVNQLAEADAGSHAAQTVADNLEAWANDVYAGTRELLALAIEKRSHFTLDLIHWIVGISEILLVAARAPATREHTRGELEKHAQWLFLSLTFIPRDVETARWMGHFFLIETVFEFALMSRGRDWPQGYDDAWDFLLRWGTQAGSQLTGWETLEDSLAALTALALRPEADRAELLKGQLSGVLTAPAAPVQDVRDRTARSLREKAETLRHRELEMKSVDRVLAANDRDATLQLLRDLANILSPATANEPVRPFF